MMTKTKNFEKLLCFSAAIGNYIYEIFNLVSMCLSLQMYLFLII